MTSEKVERTSFLFRLMFERVLLLLSKYPLYDILLQLQIYKLMVFQICDQQYEVICLVFSFFHLEYYILLL